MATDTTIPGREGGLLPERTAAGLPPFPRSKKEGIREAVLSVAARLRAIEDHFGLDPEDVDGEEV